MYTYHGPERETSPTFLSKQDVVLTTYSTLAADAAGPHSNRRGLVAVNWLRVVLDEAHTIKNVNTQQTKVLCDARGGGGQTWCCCRRVLHTCCFYVPL